MAKFTNFAKLKRSLERIGIPAFAAATLKKLEIGELEGDTKNAEHLVFGKHGIYHLEKGLLCKVILHITDKQKRYLISPYETEAVWDAFSAKKYDDPDFVQALHKYHFVECYTIKDMFSNGMKQRYYKTQRTDGSFVYSILDGGERIHHSKEQKLNACRYCIREIGKTTENFKMRDIFSAAPMQDIDGLKLDCDAVPNIYAQDWPKIRSKAKKDVGWTCEQCKRNLTHDKQYLHCHHVNSIRYDNAATNLRVLCMKCHADQPNHAHMKTLPAYKKFVSKYHAS